MSEKFLRHTEGQSMRSTSVSLWKDVYSHKVHKHTSSRRDACICVATHRSKSWLQEQNISFKYSEYSPSLPIPIESAGALGPGFSSASSKVRRNHPQVQCKAFWGALGISVTLRGSSGSPNRALRWRHSSSLLILPFSFLLSTRVVFGTFCPLWETGCSLAMSPSLQHPE